MEKMLILTIHEMLQMCNRVLQAGAIKDIWALSLQRKKIGQIKAVKDWSPHVLEECLHSSHLGMEKEGSKSGLEM